MGSFSTTSPNVVLAAGTDDYIGGIGTPTIPTEFKGNSISGKIKLDDLTIIGANSVILPNVTAKKGSTLGALSLANSDLEKWYLYAGIPAKQIKKRNEEQILNSLDEYLKNR